MNPSTSDRVDHTPMFSSLRVRNFRLFFVGQLISMSGTWLSTIAQTLLVLRLTDSAVHLGVLAAFQWAPILIIGPWAGATADRLDKRRLLIGLQTASMIQSGVLGACVLAGRAPLSLIYTLALVQGVLTAIDAPIRRSFIAEMVPEQLVANAISLNSALMTASRVIGPALAGVLVTVVGFGWTFIIDGASYLAVLEGLRRMRPAELRSPPETTGKRGQIRAGFRYVGSRPQLLTPLVMTAIVGTLAFNFTVSVPVLVTESLHGSEEAFTVMFSGLGVGSLTGALLIARSRGVTARSFIAASVMFALAMGALAVTPTMLTALPAAFVVGVTSSRFMTSSNTLLQLNVDPSFRGRVLALQSMLLFGTTPIGGPLIGLAADWFGARVAVLVGAAACAAAALYGARHLDTRQPAPAACVTVSAPSGRAR